MASTKAKKRVNAAFREANKLANRRLWASGLNPYRKSHRRDFREAAFNELRGMPPIAHPPTAGSFEDFMREITRDDFAGG